MKTWVFIDAANLYFTSKRKYNRKVDYKKLITHVGGEPGLTHVYGVYKEDEARCFMKKLTDSGYGMHFIRTRYLNNNNSQLIVDAMTNVDSTDKMVLVSTDKMLLPLIRLMKSQVIVAGFSIPQEIGDTCSTMLLLDDVLED